MATKKYYTIPHPRCNDIHIKIPKKNENITIIDNSQDLTIQVQYPGKLSINTQKILKKIQHRAYYRALNLLSAVSNQYERNFLLQLLISFYIARHCVLETIGQSCECQCQWVYGDCRLEVCGLW